MSSITKAFTAVGVSAAINLPAGSSFTYTISGTFAATWVLERQVGGAEAWEAVATGTGTATGVPVKNYTKEPENYRVRCSAYTSGTMNALLADAIGTTGAGTSAGTGVVASESVSGVLQKTVLTFTNTAVPLADEAGVVAYGGLKVYDFPAGNILVLGAVADIDLTKSSAGVNADWDGDIGVGTVTASNNATLASTEQNVIPTTATPQAAAGATTANGASTATATLDGTTTPVDLYVNLLVDDADHNVTGTACNLIMNGTLSVTWINLGDF